MRPGTMKSATSQPPSPSGKARSTPATPRRSSSRPVMNSWIASETTPVAIDM